MNTIVLTDIIITYDSGITGYATIFDTFLYVNVDDFIQIGYFFEWYPRDLFSFLWHLACFPVSQNDVMMLVSRYEPTVPNPESVTNMQPFSKQSQRIDRMPVAVGERNVALTSTKNEPFLTPNVLNGSFFVKLSTTVSFYFSIHLFNLSHLSDRLFHSLFPVIPILQNLLESSSLIIYSCKKSHL